MTTAPVFLMALKFPAVELVEKPLIILPLIRTVPALPALFIPTKYDEAGVPDPALKAVADNEDIVLLDRVTFAVAVVALLVIPISAPVVLMLLRLLMFWIIFPSTSKVETTEEPIVIPVNDVVTAVEVDNTRILFVTEPPIILLLTTVGALALFTYIPINADDAGAAPVFWISKPPTWFPVISPPELAQ